MSDFLGFRFGPYHSSDLHLIATSSSNRFNKNLLPNPKDYTLDIPGNDGSLYVGQTFMSREISINVAFTDLDELTFRRLSQIFSTDKLQDLVFDEQPYKVYRAKCKQQPQFKYVCFKDSKTQQRIYKGEGTINFICYHPYAFCFNKYIVTAADYYKTTKPETILNPLSINYNPYVHDSPPSITDEIKLHYNKNYNMSSSWDGGYPTIEQVQWGELYFTNKEGKKELLSDIRRYWDNVPKWQIGAKLLTTPTLDYDQELIYMPQYSKNNFYNMETGLNKQNALIGSRLLIYNPGDLPIDFKLYLTKLNNQLRNIDIPYHFRISRYNVQRLSVEQAVDWIGLKTYDEIEDEQYKYGTRYVGILETESLGNTTESAGINIEPKIKYLNQSHPSHFYFTEPIPRDEIVRYLKMFIYQTKTQLMNKINIDTSSEDISMQLAAQSLCQRIEKYEAAAQNEFHEYELNYEKCISEEEKNEIYWKLLISIFKGIFKCFVKQSDSDILYLFDKDQEEELEQYYKKNLLFVDNIVKDLKERGWSSSAFIMNQRETTMKVIAQQYGATIYYANYGSINNPLNLFTYYGISKEILIEQDIPEEQILSMTYHKEKSSLQAWLDSYLFNPLEYLTISGNKYPNYGEIDFNAYEPLNYLTSDYIEIEANFKNENGNPLNNLNLIFDSERRLLYNEIEENEKYEKKVKKVVYNDHIKTGKWFQIPPGWSLIEITPVLLEDIFKGKRWLDARSFTWGGMDATEKKTFEKCERKAIIKYVADKSPIMNLINCGQFEEFLETDFDFSNKELIKSVLSSKLIGETDEEHLARLENYIQFDKWYQGDSGYQLYAEKRTLIGKGFWSSYISRTEIEFLKLLNNYWRIAHLDENGFPTSDVNEWWWYANNYIWNNFPPPYWGYVDILNEARIEYIPEYY